MEELFSKKENTILYCFLTLVYIAGLFIPLMENDSAQHATMGMQMYLKNDFLHIFKGNTPYLDKPHLHFWLAALSFKIFGISHFSYRIPALIFTIIGAYSCNRLALELYGRRASHIASFIFLTAQAIILSNHDVRTDAVLTGAVILGIWQLVMYVKYQELKHILFAALGVGMAFSTKGLLGVIVCGICFIVHLAYQRKWNVLWSWKLIPGLIFLGIVIMPVLYAYYVQFGWEGVRFILWDQSFNRLNASGFEQTSPDYFFFFHTFLWAFFPWAFIAYFGLFSKIKLLFQTKFKHIKGEEILTSVGFILILLLISTSKFKLPHYLNSLLPVISVFVAGFLIKQEEKGKFKALKIFSTIQYIILFLGILIVYFVCFWAFPMPNIILILIYLLLIIGLYLLVSSKMNLLKKLIAFSVYGIVVINFCLNTQFYPNLLKYQSGSTVVKLIDSEGIKNTDVFTLEGMNPWSLDFYSKKQIPRVKPNEIQSKINKGQWIFISDKYLENLKKTGITFQKEYKITRFRITRLSLQFLNPNTRDYVTGKDYLVQL